MDIFGTVVTSVNIIIKFLSASAAYSDDAESLLHRFNWDLRVANKIIEYFEERRRQNAKHELSDEDEELLANTARYLTKLASKVAGSMGKIQSSGFLQRGRNQILWIARRTELQELEVELREWSNRFDIKLLALPNEFKFVLPASEGSDAPTPPVVRANIQLQEFLALPRQIREEKAREMLEHEPPWGLSLSLALESPRHPHKPLTVGDEQYILTVRFLPPETKAGTADFDELASGLGQLAMALSYLTRAVKIGLLPVSHCFYHKWTQQFVFAQTVPYKVRLMRDLETVLESKPFQALNQRLAVGQKLAEAVFFLHTAGFVHKNITSRSIALLRGYDLSHEAVSPYSPSIGDPYLMGFDMIRASEMVTQLEGTNLKIGRSTEFGIFQHPDRLLGTESKSYIKNYDIYSLGVVLLQIGLWEPMQKMVKGLSDNPETWHAKLLDVHERLSFHVGARYQKMVAWCLEIEADPIAKDEDFAREVLDPLEDMANALA